MNRYSHLLLFAKIVKKVGNFEINLGIYYRLKIVSSSFFIS